MATLDTSTLDAIDLAGRSALVPIRQSEGNSGNLWLGKDGAAITLPWLQALVLEGRCFTITVGTLSTGIVGGGATDVPDLDQPEFIISVPAGAVAMPFRVAIQANCADAVADHDKLEAIVCVDRTQAWDDTGTHVHETAYNMRTDNPRSSLCSCASAFSADTTDPVLGIDLARLEVKIELPANGETPVIVDLLYEPMPVPIIVGPAMLIGYFGGTSAVTGYAQVYWAEFTKAELGI